MRKGHLTGCAVGVVLALSLVTFTGGSASGLGLLVAALACPIAMVVAMKVLMGGHAGHDPHVAAGERPTRSSAG